MARRRYDRKRRLSAGAATQQEVFVRLVAGGLFFFVVLLVSVYVFLSVAGPRTARAVAPVLDRYMKAGAASDPIAAHRLYSTGAIRAIRPADVSAEFAVRDLYEGYQGLAITAYQFTPSPLGKPGGSAKVSARVSYAESPPATLKAHLVLDDRRWRLAEITIERGGP